MKKIFQKSLMLILLAFGGVHAAYAADPEFTHADSYGHGLKFKKTVLTLGAPYITWSYPSSHQTGKKHDAIKYVRMYVGADASGGGYRTFKSAPSVYFEVPYSQGAEILYMEYRSTISQRQNGAWGVANTGSEIKRGCSSHPDVYETEVYFYPGQNLTPAMLNGGFWVRWTAWWDINNDDSGGLKEPGYWLTEARAKLTNSDDGADWQSKYAGQQKYKGNGLVEWAQITYDIPTTKEVTYVRKPGGVIEAQIAGNDHADWTEYYGFSNSDAKDATGYYANSYGKTGALDKGAKGTFTLPGTYDETESYEFYYHQFYKRSVSMSNVNVTGNQTANMHFEAPRIKSTAKGFMYPSNLQITQDKWNNKVTLKWTINNNDSKHNTDGKWLVFRQKNGESGYTILTRDGLHKDNSSYTDTNLETGAEYTYWVTFAPTSYGTVSEPINTKLSVSSTVKHDDFFNFINANVELGDDGGIEISWTPEKTGVDFLFYVQRWNERTEQWDNLKDVGQTATTYVDKDVESMKFYKYRIKISYWGLDFYSEDMPISYTVMSKVKEFTASQGTYSNMVKLNWNVTILSEGDTRYVVQRKLMGDQQAKFTQIYETMGKESSFYYEDLSAQPGQFYIYKVTASVYVPEASGQSEGWAIGNSMETDGFVQTRGILSGRIKYGTGVAVPNVKVVLTKSGDNDNTAKQFYSLYLGGDNTSGVQWELSDEMIANYFTGENRPWSIQMYVHPNAGMTGTQDIFDVNGYAGVAVSPTAGAGGYNLIVKSATGANNPTYSTIGITIPANEYTHLVFSYDGGSTYTLRAIRPDDENENGVVFEEGKTLKTFTGKANVKFDDTNRSRTITFGKSGFMGNIDEMRVWTKVLTDKEVETYHNRTLSCTEKNLLAYWPVDEGINGMLSVYDYSKTNGVANGNHASVKGNVFVSEVVPAEEQLSIYSFTDENGNYVIRGVPFSGDGTTYLVRPVLGIHEFNPTYHTRYVSSNTLTHDNIEFEDISSFKVTGVVYYENTTYPVQGCYINVDGTPCSKDGNLIETDEQGRFEISVPIGDHHITIEKSGHTFANEGRYPIGVDTKFTFDREVSNLTFYDNTLVNIAGRVVGGDIEGNKSVGFGVSVNNIGVTQMVLTPVNDLYSLNAVTITEGTTSRYENNTSTLACASATDLVNSTSWRGANDQSGKIFIQTDANTGEFSALVPPLVYNISAPIVLKTSETVGNAGIIDVSNPLSISTDTLRRKDGELVGFDYHAKYNGVYHSEPSFTVTQVDFENGAFGIDKYTLVDELGELEIEIINQADKQNPIYNYGVPFFIEGNPYTFHLKGFEQYTNYDGEQPLITTVPLENCIVTIQNALSNSQVVAIEVDKTIEEDLKVGEVIDLQENQILLDEKGEALYTWKAGYANITPPYSRNISMTYEVGGQVNSWTLDGKEYLEGVILGSLPTGSNFVTQGPDKLLMILRDPPGSGSSAEWTSGTVTAYETGIGSCWNSETTIKNTHNFGGAVKFTTGAIGAQVTVETATKDDLSWGGKAVSEGENSTTTSHSLTLTQAISTSDDPSLVGSLGDIFIGQSTNLIFGKAREVGFHRTNGGEPELGVEEIFTVGSTFSTYFTYTAYYIESYLIPNWEALRNNLLISMSEEEYNNYKNETEGLKFITKLSPDDPRFGSNNHDKDVWKEQAKELGALEGPSYKVVLPKRLEDQRELVIGTTYTLDQDTIYQYNLQISNWIKHLAANEEEKVKAWENRDKKLLKNYSFDGGSSISYSYETDTTSVESHEHNSGAIVILGNVKGFEVNEAGWELETSTETGGTRHKTTSDTDSKVASFSFNLVESGDDALSVDVYNSPYSYIFRTRAGQTSAPYEDEEYTKYYEPGKHKLHEKTMQIEVPDIEVEVPTVSNITSGSAASYTLLLTNKSEIDCDLYYKLLQMDETNPNGAQLSVDGVALSDNRVIKVPAGEVVKKTLLLKQSNLGILDYENIGIVLASQEQGDPTGTFPQIADTVYISAYYVPSSSPVKMELSRTLLNTSSGTNLDITFNSFDRNYYNLKAFRIQYMKQGDTDWTMLKEYLLNVEEGQQLSSLQMPLPETANVTYSLDMSSFTDGKYTFRVLSASTYGTGEATLVTDAIEVTKDMARPMAFGTPKPTTGFLGMGDDIEITFNEDINNGRLTSTGNFIVTAALNGQQVAHDVALMATGSEGAVAKTEANINLIGKSFAVDMWVRISGEGTIFSHGNGQTKLTLGVKQVDGKYYFSVNGVVRDTEHALPADKWIYLAFSLDQEGETSNFSALYANDAETIYLADELPIEKYEGNGVVALGNGFTGAIHEVTLWDAAVDVTNLQAQMYETKMPTTEKLIGYWKFNEGLGTQAKDVARNRHMNLAATSWYLNNQNKALDLTNDALFGENDAVAIYLAECAARNGDDFAVEMWFCADKKQANGTAYLFDTDAFSVVLESGKMKLYADDKALLSMGTKAYNDGKWHHLAINVLRNGNTIVYIDGESVGQMASTNMPALQTSYMYLGAHRVESNDTTTVYDLTNKLNGQIDEIRVWNATLNAKVLRDRMNIRLMGNEPGLVAYYPFEKESLDANMQVVSEASAVDVVTNRHQATGYKNSLHAIACTDEAPALKPVLNETNVNYNFVASERGIVIELNEDADRLEGTTVNITVKDVLDLNGNMSLPITWTALVQRNQLLWFENEVDVVGRIGEEKKFTATITNQSAQTEYWVLSDLPSWLSANFTSGSLPALGNQEITFTADASAPAGKSEFTVYMSGNNAILVPLTVNMNLKSQAPEWTVDASDFEGSATLFGVVKMNVDGKVVYSEDEDDLVAAFIDEQCVGVTNVMYESFSDSYRAYLTIYGNSDFYGKEIELKVWDASTGIVHPVVKAYDNAQADVESEAKTLVYEDNAMWGDFDQTYLIYATNFIQQSTPLKKNWNWISVYVNNPDTDNEVNGVLESLDSNGASIKSTDQIIEYSDVYGWLGDDDLIYNGKMYKLKMTKADTLVANGEQTTITDIEVEKGWNWVPYTRNFPLSVDDAMAGASPVRNDQIKGQDGFAMYNGAVWTGKLTSLEPGKGYLYKSNSAEGTTIKYPAQRNVAPVAEARVMRTLQTSMFSPIDPSEYESNMTVLAIVKDGEEVVKNVQEVAVFNGSVCLAAATVESDGFFYLTIPGDKTLNERLALYVVVEGEVIKTSTSLYFGEDATYGNFDNPMLIALGEETSITNILASGNYDKLQVLDLTGRMLYDGAPAGFNEALLGEGVYIFTFFTPEGESVSYKQFVSKTTK